MEWCSGEQNNAVMDVPMVKYYLVEDLAGAEHEAGPRKIHVLGAYMGMAQPRDASGTKNSTAWAGENEGDVTAKKKRHTQKDKRETL